MQYVEAHGARIPIVGFGSMRLKEEAGTRAIEAAIRNGYRHIDTAAFYGNEREVGEAIRASGVKREEIFLTTKVRQDNLEADKFARSVENSLKLLDMPTVDLLLIHWPNAQVPMEESIGALNKAKREGLAKHIGVANYTVALLDAAMKATNEPLVTNQIEVHPFLDQTKVIAATRRHGMSVTAYCPLARGKVPGEPALERIGKAHGKTASQVALRWLVQQGIIIIPGSGTPARQQENFDVLDFSLSAAEMTEIAGLKRPNSRVVNPPQHPEWDAVPMQFTEANGAQIPTLGLGTWQLSGRNGARVIEQALRLGYRHIDTAKNYGNERDVGEALRASGIGREEIFVTTKVPHVDLAPANLERAVKQSLANLRLSDVNLLLIHWPNPRIPLAETMGAMCQMKREGYARHIGISNFTVALVDEAVSARRPSRSSPTRSSGIPISTRARCARPARATASRSRPIRRSRRGRRRATTRWRASASATARRRGRCRCAGWCRTARS